MGTRSSTETVAALLKAFLDQRTWKQAELARHVGVSTSTIHKVLSELRDGGVPLESERDHPHVYWSVGKSWYPGGVLLSDVQVTELLRLLARLPKSRARDRTLAQLLAYLPQLAAPPAVLVTPETTSREEQHVPLLEDAASGKTVLRFVYFSAHRGREGSRQASVHRVVLGPPARFVATCHRANRLKWFRVENMSDARLDTGEPFRDADAASVEAFLRASLDGFHEGGEPTTHVFFVSEPTATWVARNLIEEMRFEEVPAGIRVTVRTAGVNRLARYVVGLGGAAKALTEELRRECIGLAEAAVLAHQSSP